MLLTLRVIAVALGLLVASGARAVEVEAHLDRESVTAGNGALLSLKIIGSRKAQPEIPPVANLIVESRGQSQQIQIINGQTTASVSYNYAVGSNTPGDYQIPPIVVTIDGRQYRTQALKLKVLDAAAAQPPAGLPAPGPGGQAARQDAEDGGEKRFGFLTVELAANDRKHVYVGEIAPVRIRAWLPDDARVQLRSGIQPEGKAFTLHNVSSQPQQTRELKDGKRYTVVTWYGGISATKAGKYPASLSLSASVAVRDKSPQQQPRRRRGGPFDDPFFDNIFEDMNAPMIQKDVTLKSDDQQIEVRSLPEDGRPAGFTGAVGDFKIDSSTISGNWKTGEPQQVRAKLSGTGNFALMNQPELTPAEAWKTYPHKGEFTAGDEASFAGSKSFQWSAVPRKAGAQQVALAFSFFEPNSGSYRTVTSPVQQIQVEGKDLAEDAPAAPAAAKEPEKPRATLIGQHTALTRTATLVPLVARPKFVGLLAVAGLLGGLGGFLRWLRGRRNDPRRRALRAVEHATREAQQAADRCAAVHDIAGFFAAGRLALQHRLGWSWNQPAAAITLAEITARIPDDSPVARFFREADLHAYSRQSPADVLPQWQALLQDALATLTPPAR